ncbi:vWA domain-containing protein [Paenibacillus ginsengihumi]|uniref:vWA domain-containing protein n=1 Tax=Paenibacillus ginsengihumi TaxID=431596 RepID=UPI000375A1CA|nr:vWA domain-containing protein [Paenibacillus ginsengihumi]
MRMRRLRTISAAALLAIGIGAGGSLGSSYGSGQAWAAVPGLPLAAAAAQSQAQGAAGLAASDTKLDAVLAVDVSTSMDQSDVNKVSFEAMKMFIDMASVQGDKIGVIAYTDKILREKALLKIGGPQDKQSLKTFIDQLTRGPYTDIAVGVSEAVKVLESGAEAGHVPLIVLLTDGNNSLGKGSSQQQSDQVLDDAIQRAKEKGIPIYTIGLNADGQLNKQVLERISGETGGKLFVTSTADALPGILSEIYAAHLKLKVVPLQGFTANGGFQEVKVRIPNDSVLEANISVMSGKPVELQLTDPSGQSQNFPSDSIVYSASSAYSLLKLLRPDQGDWTLKIKGVPKEKVEINLVYNYDIQVVFAALPSSAYKPGDVVPVEARLESNGQPVTDAELYKQAKATLVVADQDAGTVREEPLALSAAGIKGSFKIPEPHHYELKVKVEDANFVRESLPVTIAAKSGGAGVSPAADEGKRLLSPAGWVAAAAAALAVIAALVMALSYYRKANRGFVGQLVVEITDEDTGERTSPQYRKLSAFKGKLQLHQLLQLAPEFAETKKIVFRPAPGDMLTVINEAGCAIEKGGRLLDAAKPHQLRANDRIKITLQNVNKTITLEYLK